MFHAKDRNVPHCSEDFVEHIRTVHFALVAVCLGLIGLVQFQKPQDASTAQRQLEKIRKVVDHWDRVQRATTDLFVGAGIGRLAHKDLVIDSPSVRTTLGWGSAIWIPSDNNPTGTTIPVDRLAAQPSSLAEFKWYWNVLHHHCYYGRPIVSTLLIKLS